MDLSILRPLAEHVMLQKPKLHDQIRTKLEPPKCLELPIREKMSPNQEEPTADASTETKNNHHQSNTSLHEFASPSLSVDPISKQPPTSAPTASLNEDDVPSMKSTSTSLTSRKRTRDDDMDISPRRGQKTLVVTKERKPLTEKDGNARPYIEWPEPTEKCRETWYIDEEDGSVWDDGEPVEERSEWTEQMLVCEGRKSLIWKIIVRVKSESCSDVTVYASKKYIPTSANGTFTREKTAYNFIRYAPQLAPHVPKFIGADESKKQILMEFIYGHSFRNCMQLLPQTTRVNIAKVVRKIAVLLHEAGLVHNHIVPENVMIRDGIETCDEADFDRHVVLIGFSQAFRRKDLKDETHWEQYLTRDLKMVENLLKVATQGSTPSLKTMEVPAEKPYEKWNRLLNKDWEPEWPRGMPFSLWYHLQQSWYYHDDDGAIVWNNGDRNE